MKFKVGDRVSLKYNKRCEGTIYAISGESVTIQRDDGENGAGVYITGYGLGWYAHISDLIYLKPISWKERMKVRSCR